MKKWIVTSLESTCAVLDKVGQIGCIIGISRWSVELDERWGTGVWGPDE